jgi:hypothetical protein
MLTENEKDLLALICIDERISDLDNNILAAIISSKFKLGVEQEEHDKHLKDMQEKYRRLIHARAGMKIRLKKRGVKRPHPNVSWIVNGRCINETRNNICNLGYACDACPWNKDKEKRK